jgi:nucleoside-diphosphate-sugar epimerase
VSVRELCERIVAASGRQLTLEHDLSQPRIPFNLYLDCSKAERELGWSPGVSLDNGIRDTLDWWRQNIDPDTLAVRDGG